MTMTPDEIIATIEQAVRAARTSALLGTCACPIDANGNPPPSWFDRSYCPEPCGSMHDVCEACCRVVGHCPVSAAAEQERLSVLAHAEWVLVEHRPCHAPGTVRTAAKEIRCLTCTDGSVVVWPCPPAALAAACVGGLVDYAHSPTVRS